jgi:hypothetical protein
VDDLCIVQISDLHNSTFGTGNARLLQKIEEQEPDIIVITGDLIVSSEDNLDVATEFIRNISTIAPVYCSLGNHEIEYEERTGINIRDRYTEAGATVLNQEYVDVEVKGQQLRIGGIYGYCLPEQFQSGNTVSSELLFMRDFEDTDRYTVLLSHLPYPWIDYGFCGDYDVDMIFTGHIHGGQVRIPFVGGLYEPEIGWFPGRCAGVYVDSETTVILSRGLGSASEKLPRINNIPEIVVVSLSS